MKFYITGSTRGLGKYLATHFDCVRLDRPFDLVSDIEKIVNVIEDDSVVILNAHANQMQYIELLKNKCKIIVCGSIAAVHADPNMIEYSKEKNQLEKFVTDLALHSPNPLLYLRLTSSSYKDYKLIANSIEFWLKNLNVTFIGYNINE